MSGFVVVQVANRDGNGINGGNRFRPKVPPGIQEHETVPAT